jgi:2,4-dienoyl-CoA reductase-like NADH-dependent reductase (Old Yellow Enzyme family)
MMSGALQFALEVVKACVDAIGADRVGIRLSPFNDFLDATDSTPYATFM